MLINTLSIKDLRVIDHVELLPEPGLNLIVGGNGAGKTSILEAIYLAGRGRTFRHTSAGPMIRRGSQATMVVIGLCDEDTEHDKRLGIRRSRSEFVCRLDGSDVKKRSTLAETLPVQLIGSQPQVFLEQGPDNRRRFVDMGLFHVEHGYLAVFAENARSLKQRNAALKTHDAQAAMVWDRSFAVAAEALHQYRDPFIDRLIAHAIKWIKTWDLGFDVAYRYRKGWADEKELEAQLKDRLEQDMRMGYTSVGPQRAEIELLANRASAAKTLSRGQQKMLVIALNLGLAELQLSRAGIRPVLLIDDLGAELDDGNQHKVVDALVDLGVQVFLTSIAEASAYMRDRLGTVFHVEHGQLRQDH